MWTRGTENQDVRPEETQYPSNCIQASALHRRGGWGEQNTGRRREGKKKKSSPRLPCLIFLTLWTDDSLPSLAVTATPHSQRKAQSPPENDRGRVAPCHLRVTTCFVTAVIPHPAHPESTVKPPGGIQTASGPSEPQNPPFPPHCLLPLKPETS